MNSRRRRGDRGEGGEGDSYGSLGRRMENTDGQWVHDLISFILKLATVRESNYAKLPNS
jgi:hypothetical protein